MAKDTGEQLSRRLYDAVSQAQGWEAKQNDGRGQSELFAFARNLRSWEWRDGSGKPVTPSGEEVARLIDATHKAELKRRGVDWCRAAFFWDYFNTHSGDGRSEFIDAWDRVRIPEGQDFWEVLERNTKELPLHPVYCPSQKYAEFVTLAGHLQKLRNSRMTIQLPVERFAKVLGVSAMMISYYRRWAVQHGILVEVKEHNRFKNRATEFRFEVDKFSWETGNELMTAPASSRSIRPL